jgi:hypothetical protein
MVYQMVCQKDVQKQELASEGKTSLEAKELPKTPNKRKDGIFPKWGDLPCEDDINHIKTGIALDSALSNISYTIK